MLTPCDRTIHGLWIIAVLTTAVIIQATLKVSSDSNTATLIGVATGFVSMIIGILAIFYSFMSSGSLNETSSRLSNSSKEIEKSVSDVAANLKEIGAKLLPLGDVARQVAEMHSKVQAASQEAQQTTPLAQQTAQNKIDASELVDYFLKVSSWSGLLTIYVAKEALHRQKPFNVYLWAKNLAGLSPEYAFGYLVACVSAGMITDDERIYQERGEILVTQMGAFISERIDKRVNEDISRAGLSKEDQKIRAEQKAATDRYVSSL